MIMHTKSATILPSLLFILAVLVVPLFFIAISSIGAEAESLALLIR